MRKIPIYNIAQEISTQLMMIVVICGYISYDFMDQMGWIAWLVIGICAGTVFIQMKSTMKNMAIVKLVSKLDVKRVQTIKRNWLYFIIANGLIIGFTILHFYLYHITGRDVMPLYKEYGIGVALGAVILYLNFFKWSCAIADKGIIVGSVIDQKMIEWNQIETINNDAGSVNITFKSRFPIKSMKLPNNESTQQIKALIQYS
jgi:hypothetical protein